MTMLDGVTIFDKAKNEETFKDGDDYTYLILIRIIILPP